MAEKREKAGQRAHHLIDTKFGARELRKLGEPELTYLAEVLRGDSLSNYLGETSMTRRFEEAFARKVGAKIVYSRIALLRFLGEGAK